MTDNTPDTVQISQPVSKISWWESSLFWRTFVLVAFLLAVSMGAWIYSFRIELRSDRIKANADYVASLVTITRAAVVYPSEKERIELQKDLADNGGIEIYPYEPDDRVAPVSEGGAIMQSMVPFIHEKLGKDTVVSPMVNGIPGLWVSFNADYSGKEKDMYWIRLDGGRLRGISGWRWALFGGITFILSVCAAGAISRWVNAPLTRLSFAARQMAGGSRPDPLPEKGALEIREANKSFNKMMEDLARVEIDRTEILAGISHDLRTPMTSLKMDIEELAEHKDAYGLTEDAAEIVSGMPKFIKKMDRIIDQFIDYNRLRRPAVPVEVNASSLVRSEMKDFSRRIAVRTDISDGLYISAEVLDVQRLIQNILKNAEKYAVTPGGNIAEVDISCHEKNGRVELEFADRGKGIPQEEIGRLLRPFTRLDKSRRSADGAGLGLSIVKRIIERYKGTLQIKPRDGGGLVITVSFAKIDPPADA